MQRELLDFMNLLTPLEEATGCLVAKIVKMQIVDAHSETGYAKGFFDARGLVRKNELAGTGLSQGDVPGFWRVSKATVISATMGRLFQVTDQSTAGSWVVVNPASAANLILASTRIDSAHAAPVWILASD